MTSTFPFEAFLVRVPSFEIRVLDGSPLLDKVLPGQGRRVAQPFEIDRDAGFTGIRVSFRSCKVIM